MRHSLSFSVEKNKVLLCLRLILRLSLISSSFFEKKLLVSCFPLNNNVIPKNIMSVWSKVAFNVLLQGGPIDRATGRGLRRIKLNGLLALNNNNNNGEEEGQEDKNDNSDNESGKRKTGMIVTHPYGAVGGNMYNHVVEALFQYGHNVLKMDATFRFNNRGIGGSEGRASWRGNGEMLDLLGACEFLHLRHGITDFLLVGYSYGSIISSSLTTEELNEYLYRVHYSQIPTKIEEESSSTTASDVDDNNNSNGSGFCKAKDDKKDNINTISAKIIGYTTIGYPFGVQWALTLFNKSFIEKTRSITGIPRLFIFPEKDNFTSMSGTEKMINSLVDDSFTDVYILQEYDHFFASEKKLAKLIECFEFWYQNKLQLSSSNTEVFFEKNAIKESMTEHKMKTTNHTQITLLYISNQ